MEKKILGRTGLSVTQLGFGAMEIRGERIWDGRPVLPEEADSILNAVLDAGINFIDTSNDYGNSERLIGSFISSRRKEYYLATKCGCTVENMGDYDETPHVWTRDNLLRNIDESLRLMKTDYVDLWQLHNPSVEQVENGGLVDVLKEAQESGRTKFIGISTTLPDLPMFLETGVFDVFQIPYSAIQRGEEDSITAVGEAGAGVIIRGGVGRGIMVRQRPNAPRKEVWDEANLDELLEEGESPTAFLLRFTLTHPYCHTTIVGTLSTAHLKENIAVAARGALPEDVYQEAKRRLAAIGEVPGLISEA